MDANVRCDLQRQLFARSERVKGIDFHPTEPWVGANLLGLEKIVVLIVRRFLPLSTAVRQPKEKKGGAGESRALTSTTIRPCIHLVI